MGEVSVSNAYCMLASLELSEDVAVAARDSVSHVWETLHFVAHKRDFPLLNGNRTQSDESRFNLFENGADSRKDEI